MFSLLITIISIALVAALALATLYYGGAAFNQGRADAEAAKLVNQGQQLTGAAELYKANHGSYPTSVAVLVADKYLQSVPQAKLALDEAFAAGTAWDMPVPSVPVFKVASNASDVCAKVNKRGYGLEGVLELARPSAAIQCYGPVGDYNVVASKGSGHMESALPAQVRTTAAIPQPADTAAWVVAPPVTQAAAPAPALALGLAVTANGNTLCDGPNCGQWLDPATQTLSAWVDSGTGSVGHSYKFTNTGEAPLALSATNLGQTSPSSPVVSVGTMWAYAPWCFPGGTSAPTQSGITLAPGDSCAIQVVVSAPVPATEFRTIYISGTYGGASVVRDIALSMSAT